MKHVSENNKWTLNDYSDDVVECIALSNIAAHTTPAHQPLILRAYMSTRPLRIRPIKTYEKPKNTFNKHNNINKRLSMKNNSFIDLY